jgi:hypothetical protein
MMMMTSDLNETSFDLSRPDEHHHDVWLRLNRSLI